MIIKLMNRMFTLTMVTAEMNGLWIASGRQGVIFDVLKKVDRVNKEKSSVRRGAMMNGCLALVFN